MAIDRRTALGLVSGGLAGSLLPRALGAQPALYLSARADNAGSYAASGFSLAGEPVFDLRLPKRGHSFAVSPKGIAVHISRRPGRLALAINLAQGVVIERFATPLNHHFCGHSVFDLGGSLLYATENDYSAGRGVIGIYDAQKFVRIGEFPTHGIGPHEIALLPDGTTLVVANGGIATHPDLPRVKLNLAEMAPSLCYIDRRDGALLGEYRFDSSLRRLSIRHLAVGPGSLVAAAMQYEGSRGDLVPLVAMHRGGPLHPLSAPPPVLKAMKQYCGSIAFDSSGSVIAVSAPRGNLVTFWDVGGWLTSVPVEDGSGVAPAQQAGEFLATSGRGGAFLVNSLSGEARPVGGRFLRAGRWDNHLVTV